LDSLLDDAFEHKRVVSTSKKILGKLLKAALLRAREQDGANAHEQAAFLILVDMVDTVTEGWAEMLRGRVRGHGGATQCYRACAVACVGQGELPSSVAGRYFACRREGSGDMA
jgi:hypothetical protein